MEQRFERSRPSLDAIVRIVERRIQERPAEGVLAPDVVEALDAVNHALCFTREPRALELWREALWHRRLADPARQALASMLGYLIEATARGEAHAAAEICDCLDVVLAPDFVDAVPSVPGNEAATGVVGGPGEVHARGPVRPARSEGAER